MAAHGSCNDFRYIYIYMHIYMRGLLVKQMKAEADPCLQSADEACWQRGAHQVTDNAVLMYVITGVFSNAQRSTCVVSLRSYASH